MVTMLALSSAVLLMGCKPKKVQVEQAPPVPTPVPVLGSVIFVQGGHLAEFSLSNSQITPLTSGKSAEWFPVASPKGDQVVYWSNADTNIYNLWKIDLASGQRTQLTFNEQDGLHETEQNLLMNDAASWTVDGKNIVYAQDGDVWEIDADGYNPKTLLSGHNAYCPSLSPDGKTLIYISKGNDPVYNIYSKTLSDQEIKQVTQYTDWNVGSPSYSADGSKLLFNLYRSDVTQVYVTKADGSDPINVTNTGHGLSPRFGQGDKRIYYASSGAGNDTTLNVYSIGANGLDAKAITTNGGASPTWISQIVAPAAVATVKK